MIDPPTALQLETLQWVADGCPGAPTNQQKTSTRGLEDRGLVTVTGRKQNPWRASPTDAGRYYLKHGKYPPGPRHSWGRSPIVSSNAGHAAVVPGPRGRSLDPVSLEWVSDRDWSIPDAEVERLAERLEADRWVAETQRERATAFARLLGNVLRFDVTYGPGEDFMRYYPTMRRRPPHLTIYFEGVPVGLLFRSPRKRVPRVYSPEELRLREALGALPPRYGVLMPSDGLEVILYLGPIGRYSRRDTEAKGVEDKVRWLIAPMRNYARSKPAVPDPDVVQRELEARKRAARPAQTGPKFKAKPPARRTRMISSRRRVYTEEEIAALRDPSKVLKKKGRPRST